MLFRSGGLSSARNTGIAWFNGNLFWGMQFTRRFPPCFVNGPQVLFPSKGQNAVQSHTAITSMVASLRSQILRIEILHSQNLIAKNQKNQNKSFCYFWLLPKVESPLPLNPNPPAMQSQNLTLYHNAKSTPNPPKIDYIIFLDSDDFWQNDLLQTCVDSAISHNPSVIWFGFKSFGAHKSDPLDLFGFKNIATISPHEWVQQAQNAGIGQFWFSWGGMIDFRFLMEQKLQFLDGIIYEDEVFGMQLFAQSRAIFVLPKKLYNYRIRENSTASNAKKKSLPPFLSHLSGHFGDSQSAWEYFCAYSFAVILTQGVAFFERLSDEKLAQSCKKAFLPTLFARGCDILAFENDIYGMNARVVGLLKKSGRYFSALKIIAKIPHKRTRYAIFLSYFAPTLFWFRIKKRIASFARSIAQKMPNA